MGRSGVGWGGVHFVTKVGWGGGRRSLAKSGPLKGASIVSCEGSLVEDVVTKAVGVGGGGDTCFPPPPPPPVPLDK